MIRRKGTGAWGPVIAAVVVSVVLLAATLFIWRGVRDASALVARGMGEAFALAGRQQLGGENYPPTQAQLNEFLEQHRADGLRYVGIFDEGVSITAGEAKVHAQGEQLSIEEGRARLIRRLRPRRPPPGTPVPTFEELERMRPPRVVYEFEPLAAIELERRSRNLLFVALLSCVGVTGLAIALTRSLRQRDRLSAELEHGRRLAALGSMSAVLAHELRNPLASLKGHAQLLAETVENDAALSPKVGRVVTDAVRLEALLTDLLRFVKSGELQRAPTDPNEVLRSAITDVGPERVNARYLADSLRVFWDAARIKESVDNVLRNAVQVSPDGALVEANLTRANNELIFSIRDRGPGIPPGDEEKIFEPFVTTRVRGVGLGLSIARRNVELHGGKIIARNAEGGGAEFIIRLPVKES